MKYVITSSASQEAIIAAVRAVDPSATVAVDVKLSAHEELCAHIRSNVSDFEIGFVNATNIAALIESGDAIGLQVTEQIRYNGADFNPVLAECDLSERCEEISDEAYNSYEHVQEVWGNQVCGDMLEEMDGLYVIMLFGLQPCEDVVNAFKNGVLQCTIFDKIETQRAIFSNYDKFVNDALNRVDFSDVIEVDIDEGLDS